MNDVPLAQAVTPAPLLPPVVWRGRGSVLALLLKNLLLGILTLGIYRFWARTRLRHYLWSNVELLGDPFVYTGTGMELFKGFLRALVVIVPLGIVSAGIDFIPDPKLLLAAKAVFFLLIFFLVFVAIYSARRYRLSRSTWRGVRFGLGGKATAYAARMVGWTVLTLITLGIATPWIAVKAQRYVTERTLFGDRRFAFDGQGRDLLRSWLLVYATLGIGYYWYLLKQFRYMTAHTSLGGVRFASAARFWPIFGRILSYLVALLAVFLIPVAIVTLAALQMGIRPGNLDPNITRMLPILPLLGIVTVALFGQLLAWPMLYIPVLRHICATLSIENANELTSVAQSVQAVPATGEGLADAFDVGLV